VQNRDICIDDEIYYAIFTKYLSMIRFLLKRFDKTTKNSHIQRKSLVFGYNKILGWSWEFIDSNRESCHIDVEYIFHDVCQKNG